MVVTKGTKVQLCAELRRLLEARRDDMLIRDMLLKKRATDENEDNGVNEDDT